MVVDYTDLWNYYNVTLSLLILTEWNFHQTSKLLMALVKIDLTDLANHSKSFLFSNLLSWSSRFFLLSILVRKKIREVNATLLLCSIMFHIFMDICLHVWWWLNKLKMQEARKRMGLFKSMYIASYSFSIQFLISPSSFLSVFSHICAIENLSL